MVAEVETAGYIWDCLFCGLRKPLHEAIHAKSDNPLNDYMALMRAARKAEGEHEQEKHNTSCTSKLGVVSKALTNQEGSANLDMEAPTQEPWSKLVEMQQQLVRFGQIHWRNPHDKGPSRVREGMVRAQVLTARNLNGEAIAKTMVQP